MSEILNEEVEAAIDEMVEESIVDTYYRMGHLINELSTGLLARAADEARKRAKMAPKTTTPHSGAETRTKKRQARKFGREVAKRRKEESDFHKEIAQDKIKKAKNYPDKKEREKATEKASEDYERSMTRSDKKLDKAEKKGSVVRAVKRTARMVNLGGFEGRRRKKRYGK
jgi:hypothetical protein